MRTIEVDEAVYTYIQSQAIPYEDKSPNDTLRRIFGLKESKKLSLEDLGLSDILERKQSPRSKSPKTDLALLVRSGAVKDGEALQLIDYTGKRISGVVAKVSGSQLSFDGSQYSMSELAKILLKKQGYVSDSVRGPAHWQNAAGKTIVELWGEYLRAQKRSKAG